MIAFVVGSLTVVISILLAIAGLLLTRRKVHHGVLKVNHEVAAVMISVLGTLYAIVLGLIVVDALNHRETAETMESTEANSVATIMHVTQTLPVDVRRPILEAGLDYCTKVMDREWQTLSNGTAPDKETVKAFGTLWDRAVAFDPKTPREQDIHASMIASVTQLSDARRYRLITCKHGIPSLLWLVLLTGGICTIGFTYFFGAESLRAQIAMTAIVTFMLALNILLVYFYGRPYSGDLQIYPSSFLHVRTRLENAPVLQKLRQTQPETQDTKH